MTEGISTVLDIVAPSSFGGEADAHAEGAGWRHRGNHHMSKTPKPALRLVRRAPPQTFDIGAEVAEKG